MTITVNCTSLKDSVAIGWGSCTCIPFFRRCKRRGLRKWGKNGDGGDEDKDVKKQGKRKAGMGGEGTRKIAEAGVGEVVQGRY